MARCRHNVISACSLKKGQLMLQQLRVISTFSDIFYLKSYLEQSIASVIAIPMTSPNTSPPSPTPITVPYCCEIEVHVLSNCDSYIII